MIDVLCIGSATLDHFLAVEKPLKNIKLGDKILITATENHCGGGASNAAVALAKLGLNVKLFTKLGSDHDADFIKSELRKQGIKNICFTQSAQRTDFSIIVYNSKEQDRVIYVHKGASTDLKLQDYKDQHPRWIYLTSMAGRSFITVQQIMKKSGARILFNPSLYLAEKGQRYLSVILARTTVLILNKEEAQALCKSRSDSKTLLSTLQRFGPQIVIITDGHQRLWASHNNQRYYLDPPRVKVVQTTGAGDAFAAGFLGGLVKNYSFEEALSLGQVEALAVIQKVGTQQHLLNEKDARKMMKKYGIKVHRA